MTPTILSTTLSSINELAKTGIIYYFIYALMKYAMKRLETVGMEKVFVPRVDAEKEMSE